MPEPLNNIIYTDDGLFYGREWPRDSFDRCVDDLLERRHKAISHERDRRTALEIGCYTGLRASLLANSGWFDEVIACDINDCSSWIAGRNKKVLNPIHFWQIDVLNLNPVLFVGKQIDHINFRRVGHFFSARKLRQALANIRNIIGSEGLVSISFDDVKASDMLKHPLLAPYQRHNGQEIKSFLEDLGFTIHMFERQESSDGENEERMAGFNNGECHMIAHAPIFRSANVGHHQMGQFQENALA